MRVVKLADGWGVQAPYNKELLPKFRALPGARWDMSAKVWRFEVSPASILDLVTGLQDLGAPVPAEILETAKAHAGALDAAAGAADKLAETPGLYPFQRDGVRWLVRQTSGILGDSMGLGKTVQACAAILPGAPVLVVCPAAVKYNWRRELLKWRPEYNGRLSICTGRGSFRWPGPGEAVLVNWDILEAAPGAAPAGTILIGDEVHGTKGERTKRTACWVALVEAVLTAGGRAWGLTGTPILNRPAELWQILDNLRLAERAFGSWGAFKKAFNYDVNGWGKPAAHVPALLERVMLRRERDKVLDLPAKTYETRECPLRAGESAAVDAFWSDIERRVAAGEIRLLPSGLPPFEYMSEIRALLATYKIPSMMALVAELEEADEPAVVFSAHKEPVLALAERPGWAVITGEVDAEERQRICDRFQAGELRGVAATIRAAGIGVTLTRAARMVLVDQEWTPALNEQAEDRIMRIGQTRGCLYTNLVADHDLDHRIAEVCTAKRTMIAATIRHATAPTLAAGAVTLLAGITVATVTAEVELFDCPGGCGERMGASVSGPSSKRPHTAYLRCPKCETFSWLDQLGEALACGECGRKCRVKVAGPSAKRPGEKYVSCTGCSSITYVADIAAPVPEEERQALRADLRRLLGRCDGARALDEKGFNRLDAVTAQGVADDLAEGRPIQWHRLKRMLEKYRKTQLGS